MADAQSTTTTLVEGGTHERKLCYRCEDLKLTVDKFIIDNSPSSFPLYSAAKRQIQSTLQLKSGSVRKNFARLHELRENRENCCFCELLCKAIERFSAPNARNDVVCSLSWEVDGRKIESGSFVNTTRRIRLSWCDGADNDNAKREAYLVFVAPRDPLRPNSDAKIRSTHKTNFLGRELGGQNANQALFKSWLDVCVNEHTKACVDTHSGDEKFMELISETYFGVIDVLDMQLKALPVKKGKPARYVALSYVWGRRPHDKPPYVTTRSNVMTHILHGGLETAWDELPKTIQDAILLVSRLGERFLWIDSLCIVQDSDSSWRLNAQAMHLVYGHAYFTICAADGDATTGLQAMSTAAQLAHPASLSSGSIMDLSLISSGLAQDRNGSHSLSADYAPGVRLMVTRPLEAVVNDSEWNVRAWTFQERILSRRCLIFAEGRAYFQCRSTAISQDIYAGSKGRGWSLGQTNSPLHTLQELRHRPFWFYIKYVNMYTGRNLTKPRDVLAAFEGISQLFDRYTKAPSVFGILTSHFDLALLWSPSAALCRRRPTTAPNAKLKCTHDEMGNCTCGLEQDAFGGTEFPSWAWCGWMGGAVEYQPKMLEGCLEHTLAWLTFHTWIQWHIRDEKGHLRPLWEMATKFSPKKRNDDSNDSDDDGDDSVESFSEDEMSHKTEHYMTNAKWRGYPGVDTEIENSDSDSSSKEEDSTSGEYVRGIRTKPSPGAELISRNSTANSTKFDRKRKKRREAHVERVGNYNYLARGSNWHHGGRYTRRRHTWIGSQAIYALRHTWIDPAIAYLKASTSFDQSDSSCSESEGTNTSRTQNKRVVKSYRNAKAKKSRDSDKVSDESDSKDASDSEIDVRTEPKPPENGYKDKYGRFISAKIPKKIPRFQAILPDNPFGTIRERGAGENISEVQYRPHLQFFTWRTELHVSMRNNTAHESSIRPSSGLCQCDIVDDDGDWCGSIVLPKEWISKREGSMFPFIAISNAKSFTEEECPVWTYYIPVARNESEWDLYFVLLLERNVERGVWERVGLGKVFQPAFRKGTWDEIKLG